MFSLVYHRKAGRRHLAATCMGEGGCEVESPCACGKAMPGQVDDDGYAHGARACQYPDVKRTPSGWSR